MNWRVRDRGPVGQRVVARHREQERLAGQDRSDDELQRGEIDLMAMRLPITRPDHFLR
jgi:hypothetical protein